MKILMKRLAGMAAIAALAMPSVAMAGPVNSAAKLSVAGSVRAPAKVKGANKLGSTVINLAIFAVIVGGGLLLITTGDDKAKSP
jgi:fructose-specific phosphotransferase system IIC component